MTPISITKKGSAAAPHTILIRWCFLFAFVKNCCPAARATHQRVNKATYLGRIEALFPHARIQIFMP